MKLRTLFKIFSKLGLIGFGGGSALIPVFEQELIHNKGLISNEQFDYAVVLGNITPGAFPVKLAAACGGLLAGTKGMMLCAYAFTLPGVLLTVLLLSVLAKSSDTFLRQVEMLSFGIAAFIIFLLLAYIAKVMKRARQAGLLGQSLLIMAAAVAMTSGGEIRRLITALSAKNGLPVTPFMDISVANLILISLFLIFFIGVTISLPKILIALSVLVPYLGSVAKTPLLLYPQIKTCLPLVMVILSAFAIYRDIKNEMGDLRQEGGRLKIRPQAALKQATCFAAMIVLCALAFYLLSHPPKFWWFIYNGIFAAATSFGGGEAFLSVADGIFIAEGFIPAAVFYNQILPIANALPGPILVKVLAAIAYTWGVAAAGQLGGWLAALLAITIGVGTSCIIFVLVGVLYHSFSELSLFRTMQNWIMPVICGLLISTMLAMLVEMLKISAITGLANLSALALFGGLLLLCYALHKKTRLPDLMQILICGALGWAILFIF